MKTNKLTKRTKRTMKYLNRKKRHNKPISPLQVYPVDVNANGLIQPSTDPLPNMEYDIAQSIYDNGFYQSYVNLYQEYKIQYVQIHIIPVIRSGNQPPMGYAVLLANEDLAVRYADIPSLPSVTKIYGRGITQLWYKSKGRQDDLNRWYNTKESMRARFILPMRFVEPLGITDNDPHYAIQVRARVLFRRPFYNTIGSKNNEEEEKVEKINRIEKEQKEDEKEENISIMACSERLE